MVQLRIEHWRPDCGVRFVVYWVTEVVNFFNLSNQKLKFCHRLNAHILKFAISLKLKFCINQKFSAKTLQKPRHEFVYVTKAQFLNLIISQIFRFWRFHQSKAEIVHKFIRLNSFTFNWIFLCDKKFRYYIKFIRQNLWNIILPSVKKLIFWISLYVKISDSEFFRRFWAKILH